MNKDVLSMEDLARESGVPSESLAEWTKVKLLKPAGFTDGKAPLFAAAGLDRVAHIRRLADLGYGAEEILKIIKKVGLPRDGHGRKQAAKGQLSHRREPGRALRRQPADDQALGGQGHHRARHADGRRVPPLLGVLRLSLPAHPRPPALRLHARGDQGRLGRRPDPSRHRGRSRTPSPSPKSRNGSPPCSRPSGPCSTR